MEAHCAFPYGYTWVQCYKQTSMVVGHYLSPQDSRVLTLSTLQQAYTSHTMLILITQCCYILHEVCINRCQSIDDGFYLSFFLVSNMKFPC